MVIIAALFVIAPIVVFVYCFCSLPDTRSDSQKGWDWAMTAFHDEGQTLDDIEAQIDSSVNRAHSKWSDFDDGAYKALRALDAMKDRNDH